MEKFFEEYLKILQNCHDEMSKSIEGLSPAALDWAPAPETNSISVLIYHTTGSERYWIGDVAMQESSNRDRDAEFRVKNLGEDVLKQRLDAAMAYARSAVERLRLEDLGQSRMRPNTGEQTTVAYALLHSLEHVREHVGHIQLTSQLWKQAHP